MTWSVGEGEMKLWGKHEPRTACTREHRDLELRGEDLPMLLG
jgi:hypothetical protein